MYQRIVIEQEEIKYLSQIDEKMKRLVQMVDVINRNYIPNPFIALVNSIVYQQLSYKAANTIWDRFELLLKEITPQNVLNASVEELRACGLSKPKINYIKNIADAITSKQLDLDHLEYMSNDEIIEQLIKIKGIGEWTAEMFLIFSLQRKDVFAKKDLALVKGIKWLYELEELPTKDELDEYIKKFSPYNTIASYYLWEITIRNYFQYKSILNLS